MLGGFRVSSPGLVVDKFPTQRTAALLAYLATFSRTPHYREVLGEIFWPDADPESQRHSLRLALSRIRILLGPDHPVDAGRLTVQLKKGRFVTDVAEFEGAVSRGDRKLASLLYAGPFLPGYYEDWVLNEQTRLEMLLEEIGDGETRLPETLPRESGPFFGRKSDVAAVESLLKTGQILTLTGPGGIGKTRLARAIAKSHGRSLWVPLADISDSTQTADVIREALRLPSPAPGFAVEDMVARELADLTPVLLVLDNAEHLVGVALVELIERLSRIDGIGLLITSRRALAAQGEVEYPVGPLEDDDGVALFEERARRTRPDFATSTEAVRSLAKRLGGMPLALELAAARVGVQDISQLETLEWAADHDFGGTFDIPKRQRSLDNVLRTSLELLSEEARFAFSQLGVFRGGFDAAAAKAVAKAGPAALETLRRLGLIIPYEEASGSLRFRMPEPLRDIAAQECGNAHDIHAAYFADWIEANRADELPPPPYEFGLRLALQNRERDNIRAALQTCLSSQQPADREVGLRIVAAFWTHWYVRNEGLEMDHWATSLLEGPGSQADPLIQASARLSRALAIRERGAREACAEEVSRALAILIDGPRDRNLAFAWHLRGFSLADLGRLEAAESAYLESEAIWQEIGDLRNFSITRHNRGMLAVERGDLDVAEALVGVAMEIFREHNSTYTAIAYSTMGSIRRARKDYAGACAALTEAIKVHHRLGYVRGWAQNERDLGLCLHELGKKGEAQERIEEAVLAFRRVGDRHGEATALAALTLVTGETWHADEARGVMQRHRLPAVGELLEGLTNS